MTLLKYLIVLLVSTIAIGQENDDYSKRLKAIINQNTVFYNIDGVEFSSETFKTQFTEKGLKKLYKKYNIKNDDNKVRDDSLPLNNFVITKSEAVIENLSLSASYYFIENENKTVTIIGFNYYNNQDKAFERKYIDLIIKDKIPEEVFETLTIDSIDFAGRKIQLGNSCYWTAVNTVQCPRNGEMNWSVHKTFESAKMAVENQFSVTKNRKGGKVLSETEVDVEFEGTETRAKKVIYDFTGLNSVLVGMSGGKTLTIYYVASKVRENYVSCCMSFWNNDNKTESGLSPLLEEVMKLKK